MKNKTLIFVSTFIFLMPFLANAQSVFAPRQNDVYFLKKDKKPSFYQRQMNKMGKEGKKIIACANALQLLAVGKKKHLKKANEFLSANFKSMIEDSKKKADALEAETATFVDESSAVKATELFDLYRELQLLHELSNTVSSSYNVSDFSAQKTNAFENRKKMFESAAQHIFEKSKPFLAGAKKRVDFLGVVRKYDLALKYDPSRDDIKIEKEKIILKATTKFGVGQIKDEVNNYGISVNEIRTSIHAGIKSDMRTKGSKYLQLPYFKLISNDESLLNGRTNVILTASIRDVNFEYVEDEPSTSKHNNDFEEDGVEKIVYATYTAYGKTAYTKVEGTYTITDMETGKVLKSDSITGSDSWRIEWGTYTGDERALSKRQKNRAKQKNEPYPNKTKLVKSASFNFVNIIEAHVKEFAQKWGQ